MRSRHIVLAAVVLVLFSVWVLALSEYAGTQDPTNPPGSTSSYTLEDIYNRLNTGADGSQSTFTEPAAGPDTPTMFTLNEIIAAAPAKDNTNGAKTSEVLAGKKFWGLNVDAGEWGLQTGELSPGESVCNGTMYSDGVNFFGKRWCIQSDGTVLDMTTGVVWLRNANFLLIPWNWNDAVMKPIELLAPLGDWWLPTKDQLDGITNGDEYILSDRPGPFVTVQPGDYWSRTTTIAPWFGIVARYVGMDDGEVGFDSKSTVHFVWPVREGQ